MDVSPSVCAAVGHCLGAADSEDGAALSSSTGLWTASTVTHQHSNTALIAHTSHSSAMPSLGMEEWMDGLLGCGTEDVTGTALSLPHVVCVSSVVLSGGCR